jgi:hypothetical protein
MNRSHPRKLCLLLQRVAVAALLVLAAPVADALAKDGGSDGGGGGGGNSGRGGGDDHGGSDHGGDDHGGSSGRGNGRGEDSRSGRRGDGSYSLSAEDARRAVARGETAPLTEILGLVRRNRSGRVVAIDLRRTADDAMIYDVVMIDDRGESWNVSVDARRKVILRARRR